MRKWQRHGSRPRWVGGVFDTSQVPPGGESPSERRFARRFLLFSGVVAVVAVVAVRWWERQPLMEVRMEGNSLVDSTELLALVPRDRVHDAPQRLGEWATAVLRHPLIASAAAYWEAPGIVRIVVREHKLLGILRDSDPPAVVDETGVVRVMPLQGLPARLPKLDGVESFADVAPSVAYLLRVIPQDSLARVRWEDAFGWVVQLRDGSTLLLGDTVGAVEKWYRWSCFRRSVPSAAPLRADLRWQRAVVVQPPVE
ncbi:MAG: hypothetical protein NZ473_05370 [Candidatus Kapabacteria bacterium]|nr:hypothetical protein [Candidatus Kapabacteria bacterium]MCS7169771.1 hypothetical protein [Candidatus Kapabacteria bacterium]MDW7996458.1 hypothetical protein [Bacteroidota bacterium]MDW8225840.1 hypothetical protein [Bacteroidota bacterium]